MLRTILEQNHHAWRLISRDPDQSDHGGHESAGPLSSFWLRVAVSVTDIVLQTQGVNPRSSANGPTVDGYSKLSRVLARAPVAALAVATGRP